VLDKVLKHQISLCPWRGRSEEWEYVAHVRFGTKFHSVALNPAQTAPFEDPTWNQEVCQCLSSAEWHGHHIHPGSHYPASSSPAHRWKGLQSRQQAQAHRQFPEYKRWSSGVLRNVIPLHCCFIDQNLAPCPWRGRSEVGIRKLCPMHFCTEGWSLSASLSPAQTAHLKIRPRTRRFCRIPRPPD
jgi:hypothetical protein